MRAVVRMRPSMAMTEMALRKAIKGPGGEVLIELLSTRSSDVLKDPLEQHALLHAAMTRKADALKRARLVVKTQRLGDPDAEPEAVPDDDPLQRVFDGPNRELSGRQSRFLTALNLDTDGRAFWVFSNQTDGGYDPSQPPDVIWIIHPTFLEEKLSSDKKVLQGWRIKDGQPMTKTLDPEQVLLMRYPHPKKRFKGLSKLEALRLSVEGDFEAAAWSKSFFDNGAVPGVALTSDQPLTPEQRREEASEWNEAYRGARNAGKVAVLSKGTTMQVVNQTHRNMEFSGLHDITIDRIVAVTGTPRILIGKNERDNRATAGEVIRAWWEATLIPWLEDLSDCLQRFFRPLNDAVRSRGFRYVFEWDLSRIQAIKDLDQRLERATVALAQLGYPRAEVNRRFALGMKDRPEDGFHLVNHRLVPDTEVINNPGALIGSGREADAEEGGEKSASAGGSLPHVEVVAGAALLRKAIHTPHSYGSVFARAYDKGFRDPVERVLLKAVRSYYDAVAKKQLARIESLRKSMKADDIDASDVGDSLVSPSVWADAMKDVAPSALRKMWRRALGQLEAELDGFEVVDPADLTDQRFVRMLNRRVAEMVKLAKRDRDLLRRWLRRAITDAGGTITRTELRNAARDFFRRMKNIQGGVARAETIARTEGGIWINSLRNEAMAREGVKKHEWLTAGDDAVRDQHRSLHGEVRELGDVFARGLKYPQDPAGLASDVVQCRCVTVPVSEGEA